MSNVLTTRVSDDLLAMIDRIAAARDRSRSWVVAKLIENAARDQIEMDDFIQAGIDSADSGRLIPHDDVVAWFAERKAKRRLSIASE